MRTCLRAVTAVAVFLLGVPAQAGHFCHHCGCQRDCKKVCRLEVKTKKKKDVEYSCECEDFCVPGPSKRCGFRIDSDCNGHPQRTFIWQPQCAKVYTRKKLVAKEVTKEVPDYKWVVEKYCCVCGHYIKVEDGDKSGDGKSGGDKTGDAYKKSERPPALLSADVRAEEMRVGDNRGYNRDDTPQEEAAVQPRPIANTRGNPPAIFRFLRTKGDDEPLVGEAVGKTQE